MQSTFAGLSYRHFRPSGVEPGGGRGASDAAPRQQVHSTNRETKLLSAPMLEGDLGGYVGDS